MKKLRLPLLFCMIFLPVMMSSVKGLSPVKEKMVRSDIAIIVNFPDKPILIPQYISFWNFWAHVFDFNRDNYSNVGHTGVILLNGTTGDLQYYDFGRYDDRDDLMGPRPAFYGTVRSKRHVPGLELNIKAKLVNGWITNLDTLLIHLGAKKLFKTYGPIESSVVYNLDLDRMLLCANEFEDRGYIYYGAPTHLYCTRFVREVIRAGGSSFGVLTFTGTQTVKHTKKKWPA